MIISLVAGQAGQGRRALEPYAAWTAAVRKLREEWECGDRPGPGRLADHLAQVHAEERSEALQDLVAEHLRLSWGAGCGTRLEEYAGALPELAGALPELAGTPIDLIEDEFLARYTPPHGDAPALDEYARRFPARTDVQERLGLRFLGSGRYVKLRRIGAGALGEVWEGWDRQLARAVAVKSPRAEHAVNPAVLDRFLHEARVTAGLEHRGIAGVHEIHTEGDGAPFIVMRLVAGRTLGECIARARAAGDGRDARTARRPLLESFLAACDAVGYAHSRGVVHGDLKPGNVLVGDFGDTVVIDWGMARGPGTAADGVAGTPEYMAPEQADGVADERSDVFGLGAILYEILTGVPPHRWPAGVRPADWREIVRRAQVARPRTAARGVPRALEQVCMAALERDSAHRTPGAARMAEDVRRYLAGDSEARAAWNWIREKLRLTS